MPQTQIHTHTTPGEEGWLATHVAAAPSSSSSARTHPGNRSGGSSGNHREQTLHLGVEGVLQQLEEVDLGGSGGHDTHTATGGGAAVVSPPPEGVVLVGGEGEDDGEEEEPGRATVVLAPGMVTVVDEHFSAGREVRGGDVWGLCVCGMD